MSYQIKHSDCPHHIRKVGLTEHLYKEAPGFKSALLGLYEKEEPLEASLAWSEAGEAVGIALLRKGRGTPHQGGLLHLDNRVRKNPWKQHLPYTFLHLGTLMLYVKEEHRNQGLGVQLAKDVVGHAIGALQSKVEQTYVSMSALERAHVLCEKHLSFLCLDRIQEHHGNFSKSVSHWSYVLHFQEGHAHKTLHELQKECPWDLASSKKSALGI